MAKSVVLALMLSITVLFLAFSTQATPVYLEPHNNSTVSTVYLALTNCSTTYSQEGTSYYRFITAYPTSNRVLVDFTAINSTYALTNTSCWNTTLSPTASIYSLSVPYDCTSGCGATACPCESGQQCSSAKTAPCIDDFKCDNALSICIANTTEPSYTVSTLFISFSSDDSAGTGRISSYIEAQRFACGFGEVITAYTDKNSAYVYLIQNNDAVCDATFWANLSWDVIPGYTWKKRKQFKATFTAAQTTQQTCFDSEEDSLLCEPSTCNMKCLPGQTCDQNSDCANNDCNSNFFCELPGAASVQQISFIIMGFVLAISVIVGLW